MRVNKEEQTEECFITDQFEQISQTEPLDFKVEITKKINQQMPANELREVQRPNSMIPRTFYLDRPLYFLKEILNLPQNEIILPVTNNKQKLRICNSKNLSIQQYFSRKKFECIYNKLQSYRNDSKSFLGKLKGIDLLIDYNQKQFKELEIQIDLLNDSKQDKLDSDFESGNICRAYLNTEISMHQYYLLMENDLNTYGYNNWFFFRFRNHQTGVRRFNIVNFVKKTNFFAQGMLISIFSVKKHYQHQVGWAKGGDNITFGEVNLTRQHHENLSYYSLCFEYNFQYENDEVYFALAQPYTYSRLITFINKTKHLLQPTKYHFPKVKMQVKTLGYTITNNIIPLIRFHSEKSRNDKAILILGRQHPCQTVGSFIAQKMMEFVSEGKDPIGSYMIDHFDIFVIPMVNPDGVIHGMSRTNMAGLDLNRHWGENILKQLTPETMKIKQFIINLSKVKKIKYMIDLHGHGKKLKSFLFCCKQTEKGKDNQLLTLCMNELETRFNLQSCTFGVSKDKQNTIRSQLRGLGIKNSYTFEASLYGWKKSQNQILHFNQSDYQSMGVNILKGIFLLEGDSHSTNKYLGLSRQGITKQIGLIMQISEKEQKLSFENTDIMSDSDPEGDKLDVKDLLGKCQNKLIRKKLQENYSVKRNIAKKYKKLSTMEANKESIQNLSLRQSYAPGMQTSYNPATTMNNNQGFLNITDCKIERKTITKVKLYEKNERQKKPVTIEKSDKSKLIESLNMTSHTRNKMKTLPSGQDKRLTTNKFKFKTQATNPLTTQKIDLQAKTEPDQSKATKTLQTVLTRNQLKKESVYLLTDTISIFRFKQGRQSSNSRFKHIKNVSLDYKREISHHRHKNELQQKCLHKDILPSQIIFKKAKNFNNLASVKSTLNSTFNRPINTVYYHFPVL